WRAGQDRETRQSWPDAWVAPPARCAGIPGIRTRGGRGPADGDESATTGRRGRRSGRASLESFSSRARTQAHPLVRCRRLMDSLLREVRLYIYDQIIQTAMAPSTADAAVALSQPLEVIESAYRALADAHAIVLRPETTTIWMAMPFANTQTAF